uniref:Uncharacterized protein n=1 Tax=Rhizophora mucronata TaxID=61149 RepID=A0A2P2N188_RHIMU
MENNLPVVPREMSLCANQLDCCSVKASPDLFSLKHTVYYLYCYFGMELVFTPGHMVVICDMACSTTIIFSLEQSWI